MVDFSVSPRQVGVSSRVSRLFFGRGVSTELFEARVILFSCLASRQGGQKPTARCSVPQDSTFPTPFTKMQKRGTKKIQSVTRTFRWFVEPIATKSAKPVLTSEFYETSIFIGELQVVVMDSFFIRACSPPAGPSINF